MECPNCFDLNGLADVPCNSGCPSANQVVGLRLSNDVRNVGLSYRESREYELYSILAQRKVEMHGTVSNYEICAEEGLKLKSRMEDGGMHHAEGWHMSSDGRMYGEFVKSWSWGAKKSFDGLELYGFNTIVCVIVSPIFCMNREN